MLGYLFEEGRGVAKSRTEGAKWYREAAEAGSHEAMEVWACCISSAAASSNYSEAAKWYPTPAERGSVYGAVSA